MNERDEYAEDLAHGELLAEGIATSESDMPEPEEGDNLQNVPSAEAPELSEAQFRKAQKKAQQLMDMEKHPMIMGPALCLAYARQAYNMAMYALNRNLEGMKIEQEQGVFAVIVDAMGDLAMKAYSRDRLVAGLQKLVLPLAMVELNIEEQEMKAKDMHDKVTDAEARADVEVSIGYALYRGGEAKIGRERNVVIAGPARLVDYLMRNAGVAAVKSGSVVIHLMSKMQTSDDRTINAVKDKKVITVGAAGWTAFAENPATINKAMLRHMRRTYKNRCDLLIISDITNAQQATFVGMPVENLASSAQRMVRKWADEVHCAVICGLPLTNDQLLEAGDKFNSHGWQQLEVHTVCRLVSTEPIEGNDKEDMVWLTNPWKPEDAFALFPIPKEKT